MVASGGRPGDSTYLDNQDFAALNTMTEGHFGGVGMVMGMKDDHTFVVVSPIEATRRPTRRGIKSEGRAAAN